MKTAVIPQVRIEPELRAELESALRPGETLSEFVEASVRSALEYRRVQTAFHARGQAAWEAHQRGAETHSADEVVADLRSRLQSRRRQLLAPRG